MADENAELNYEDFVRARKLHWMQEAKNAGNDVEVPELPGIPFGNADSNFMLYSPGPNGVFAVFEDGAETGWFYLYDATARKIVKCAHIYNRANVAVEEDVIDIGWAADDSACGLALWGEFRAFLGVSSDVYIEKPVGSPEDAGIPPAKWPAGFQHYLEKKIE